MDWSNPDADPWGDIQKWHRNDIYSAASYSAALLPTGQMIQVAIVDEATRASADPDEPVIYPRTCSCNWLFCHCDFYIPETNQVQGLYGTMYRFQEAFRNVFATYRTQVQEQVDLWAEFWEEYEERRKSRERPAHAGPPPPPKPVRALSSVHIPSAHRRPGRGPR